MQEGIEFLVQGGLNLLAVFDCATLPDAVVQIMAGSGVPLSEYRRLVLIGHGGQRMWEVLQEQGMETADPAAPLHIAANPVPLRPFAGYLACLVWS